MSPTRQELKITYRVSALLGSFLHQPGAPELYQPQRISHEILIASLIPVKLCNENHFVHVPICILRN